MVATHHMTIDEFATMPQNGLWELIDGKPIEVTPSAGRPGWIAGQIAFRLQSHVQPGDLGWVFPAEVGFILFDDRATVRSPDVAFVRRDRLSEPPDSFIPLAPDFAVEVLSPSDRWPDALAKAAMYLQAGVQLVWLIDPAKRNVTVIRLDDVIATAGEGDVLDAGEVIPGFRIPVSEIFG